MRDHAIEEMLESEDKLPLFHKGYVDVTLTALKDIPAAMAFQPLNDAHPAISSTLEVAKSDKLSLTRV